jgi:hypothetical protein
MNTTLMRVGTFLVVGICCLTPALSKASATSVDLRPTLSQLEGEITASVKIKDAPPLAKLIPNLSTNDATITMVPMPSACYGSWPPSVSQPIPKDVTTQCEWGDTAATRSIVLMGDSQASMWLPAFNSLGLDLGWKIIFIAKKSCSPWITNSRLMSDSANVYSNTACKAFVKSEIEFVNSLHPTVVIPVGLQVVSANNEATEVQDEDATAKTLAALKPSGSKILLLQGFSWAFSGITPQDCLTIHSTDLTGCEVTRSDLKGYSVSSGLKAAAKKDQIGVVPTLKLFCTERLCPIFVKAQTGYHLVYFDLGHMNSQYSVWISRALETLMVPYLPPAA